MTDSEQIYEATVVNGVEALKACAAKLKEQKRDLFALGDAEYIFLQFGFKKVSLQRQTTKIVLPHPVVDEMTPICLFVSDIDRNERDYSVTVDKYQEMLDQAAIKPQISIVPLKQLKLEYKEYESKRQLLAMYDMFLADARIIRLLPSHLGRHFFKRKRFPVQVNLTCSDLKKEMTRALSTSCCALAGRGSSGQMTVGKLSQTTEQVTENILRCVGKLASSLPGGWNNIRSAHIKAQDTPAIPIYVSFGSKDEVELPRRKRVKEEQEAEEVSTVTSGKVMVSKTGTARIVVAAGEKTAPRKTTPKTGKKGSTAKKDGALRKNKSSLQSTGSSVIAGRKLLEKTTAQRIGKTVTEQQQQRDVTRRPTLKSVKRSMPQQQQQQPLKKKKRLD